MRSNSLTAPVGILYAVRRTESRVEELNPNLQLVSSVLLRGFEPHGLTIKLTRLAGGSLR